MAAGPPVGNHRIKRVQFLLALPRAGDFDDSTWPRAILMTISDAKIERQTWVN